MKVEILDSAPGRNDSKVLKINDARIIYRDFSGQNTNFSNGDPSFSIVIDDEHIAQALESAGYNIKRPDPSKIRDDGTTLPIHMKIKIKFNNYGPDIYLVTNGVITKVPQERIADLDHLRLVGADMDIRGWDYDYAGRKGRAAYLNSLKVYQQVDRFAEEYNAQQHSVDDDSCPF